jgi:NADH dehydrogenase
LLYQVEGSSDRVLLYDGFQGVGSGFMQKNIVVIGAGYGGVTAALRLGRLFRNSSDYAVHLVDKNPYHTLKTQLHEAAVHRSDVTIDIGRIIRNQNITFHLGLVTAIDFPARSIRVADRTLPFDYLVIALGSQANYYNIPGLELYSFPLQSASDASAIYHHLSVLCAAASSEAVPARRKEMLRFIVGGGGLSGIEFAGELVEHLTESVRNYRLSPDEPEVIVVEAANDVLPSSPPGVRSETRKRLEEKGVRILTGTRVVGVTAISVNLSTSEALQTRTLVWTGGIRISDLTRRSGLAIGEAGRLIVNAYLQSVSSPFVYAIGDNALAMNPATRKPVPAAAQFALQQGRLVAENIASVVRGKVQKPYVPRVWGEVVSLGRHLAAGWIALPFLKKLGFIGFIASLLKSAIKEKHIILLRKEARSWVKY